MSIYHLSVKAISRSAGRSSTAAAAYRSAERVVDERTGEVHDYTRKEGVIETGIVLPAGSEWKPTRSELWNAAELAERRKDACVAREHEVALPSELNREQQIALVRGYAKELAERHGCAVDFAIHEPRTISKQELEDNPGQYYETDPETERRHNGNWHAHVLCTTRKVEGQGLGAKCDREKAGRKARDDLDKERRAWSFHGNRALSRAGVAAFIDHRSLKDQGIEDREPTKHLGPSATSFERRTGEVSDRRRDLDREAGERLSRAKEAGELDRKAKEIEAKIIDTKSSLEAALAERRAHQEQSLKLYYEAKAEVEAKAKAERQAKALQPEPAAPELPRVEPVAPSPEPAPVAPEVSQEVRQPGGELEAFVAERNRRALASDKLPTYRTGNGAVCGEYFGPITLDGQRYGIFDAGRNERVMVPISEEAYAQMRMHGHYKGQMKDGRMHVTAERTNGREWRKPGEGRDRGGMER